MSTTGHRLLSFVATRWRQPLPKPPTQLPTRLLSRYKALPPWLLLAQTFLAFGWLRAAVAHGVHPRWWDGGEIALFVADYGPDSVEWYGATMLDGPVESWPVAIAVLVFGAQSLTAVLLLSNVRPLWALALGAGLNVNFILAGAVNPSVFYLIISAALALWHVENSMGLAGQHRLTSASTLVGAVAVGALVPEVQTVNPEFVIEDPALVLSFAILLWVGALQLNTRARLPLFRPMPADPDDQSGVRVMRRPYGGPPMVSGMTIKRCDRTGRPGMGMGRGVG